MLYIIKIDNWNRTTYRLIDTNTDSVLEGNKEFVRKLVKKYKFDIANADIVGNQVILKKWPNEIAYSGYNKGVERKYIMLAKVGEYRYKVVHNSGRIAYMDTNNIRRYTRKQQVANCYTVQSGNKTHYGAKDTIEINNNEEFNKQIDEKYKQFVAKSTLLGADIRFRYIIEGANVRLDLYTGTSKRVIIPSFITSISEQAFFDCGLTEVKLNEGLRFIGSNAFKLNQLSEVIIPSTVEYIGQWAFTTNNMKEADIILQNKNTILLSSNDRKTTKTNGLRVMMRANTYEKR